MGNFMRFTCPKCGGDHIKHHEDVVQHRDIRGIENGVVIINNYGRTYYEDAGDNARFWCVDCDHEWPIGDTEIDFK